jgi:tetratricopeptide (TPR) repeat protein
MLATMRIFGAQTYDRDLADVFAIQSEIAKAIADQLQAKLSPTEKNAIEERPTTDVAAFDLYTQAKTLLLNTSFSAKGLSNMLQAVDLLNRAIARDPSFFQAYCVLASAHNHIYFLGNEHTPARLAAAEAAIQSASRMRPDAGETHLARAENLYRGYYDYDGALAELEIARRTLSNDPRIPELAGYIVRRRGKQEEGLQYLLRSLELDPRNFLLLQQTALSYQILQRYAEMARVLDRGLAIKPDDIETRAARAVVEFDWKADTRPVHQLMQELRARNPAALKRVADTWFTCALAERDLVAAEAAISALGENAFNYNQGAIYFNHLVLDGLIARMMNDEAKARAAFTAARPEQEKVVQAQPNHGPALCVLGLIDAGLGRKEEALREIRHAVELVPMEKDTTNATRMIHYSAIVYAWVGEKDLALQNLAKAVQLPGFLSYGRLKLMPWYDPLRGDPRFDKIVNSLAPRTAQ